MCPYDRFIKKTALEKMYVTVYEELFRKNLESEEEIELRRRRTRNWKIVGITALVIFLTAGSLWYFLRRPDSDNADLYGNADLYDKDHIVMATGVTESGADTVTFAVRFPGNISLCVEDVYLLAGDTVAAGEPYIKFTDESIRKARAELERAVQQTDLAYRDRVVSSGSDKIQAKYTYDTAVLEADHAPQVYQDTLTQLEMQLARAEQDCRKAQEDYNAYYLAVENDTFQEDYRIEELQKAYEDAYDLCAQRSAYYKVTQEELNALAGSADDVHTAQNGSDRQWIVRSIALLQEEAVEAKQAYEQAKQAYQQEIEGAELKLQKLLNQSELAQQRLTDAQIECQKGGLRARTLYELTTAKGQTAKNDHDVSLISLDEELECLREARDEAIKNKELFEELAGDGYWCTERPGTILRTYAEKGQEIGGGDPLLAYGTEEMFVTVTVPEIYAEKLFVGGSASVTVEDGQSCEGIVTAVLPVAVPGVGASACSLVIVSLAGDVSAVGVSQTAAVEFGNIIQCSADGYETDGRSAAVPMYDPAFGGLFMQAEAEGTGAGSLQIAEIYAEAGQHISEGDAVCRFTQDSVEDARKTLLRARADAHKALVRAQTDYHIDVLSAGLAHNESLLDAALAQTLYDNTIAGLNSKKVEKFLEIETLLSEIYQLQTDLTGDDHQQQRADLAQAYDRAKRQMESARERFVTSQVDAAQTFQDAREAYEAFLDQSEDSNRQIADKVQRIYALQEEIRQGEQFLERELMAAEQARIKAEAEGEAVGARYESIVTEKEKAVRDAQEELERAVRRLDEFDRTVGDGVLHAAGSGRVTVMGYREGDWLDNVEKLMFYVADENGKEVTG